MITDFMRVVLELDQRLKVTKTDPIFSQMMGILPTSAMRGQYLYK